MVQEVLPVQAGQVNLVYPAFQVDPINLVFLEPPFDLVFLLAKLEEWLHRFL